jgi:hypothetical protein
MDKADGIWFVCPECGASNRAGDSVCFLCDHRLDAARPEVPSDALKRATSRTAPELVNPYAPPGGFDSPALTFRISSLLLVIAVIAVCLGVWHEVPFLGIMLAVVAAPALVYTSVVAARSRASGQPMSVFDKVGSFAGALAGVVVIEFSALIGFGATCMPAVGIAVVAGANGQPAMIAAVVVGGIGAVAAATLVTYFFLTRKGRTRGIPGKP